MLRTSTPIQDLKLGPSDQVFFHLFNNFSIFIKDPLQKQITLISSLTDPQQLLRYSLHSKRFYEVAKSEALVSHWQKNLSASTVDGQHPFDTLLSHHCKEMGQLARAEQNEELAKAFEALLKKYDRKEAYFSVSNEAAEHKAPLRPSRKLPCKF